MWWNIKRKTPTLPRQETVQWCYSWCVRNSDICSQSKMWLENHNCICLVLDNSRCKLCLLWDNILFFAQWKVGWDSVHWRGGRGRGSDGSDRILSQCVGWLPLLWANINSIRHIIITGDCGCSSMFSTSGLCFFFSLNNILKLSGSDWLDLWNNFFQHEQHCVDEERIWQDGQINIPLPHQIS